MSKKLFYTGLVASVIFGWQGAALAFDPLFFVTETLGSCYATLPNSDRAVELTAERAYPFGTKITTGPDGEARLEFSEANGCIVHEKSEVVIADSPRESDMRIVKLERGSATLKLVNDFNQEENAAQRVTIQTVAGIGEAMVGGEYTALSKREKDMTVCNYVTVRGEMRLYDNHLFEVPALKRDNEVELSISPEKGYLLLRDVKGQFLVDLKNLKDDQGAQKIVEMKQDYMIKMWRRLTTTGDTWVVSIIAVSSTGGLIDASNYNVANM